MLVKCYFRYHRETFSFYNKWIKRIITCLYIGGIIGFAIDTSNISGLIGATSMITVFTICLAINTNNIKKKYELFKKNGEKYNGKIVAMISEYRGYDYEKSKKSYYYYLLVEYINDSGEPIRFETARINSNPYTYLSSLDVSVYVLPDGKTLATDFKRINKLKDSVINTQNCEEKIIRR